MLARFARNAQALPRAILDLLFPPRCVVCRGAGEWFCAKCQSRIEKINPPFCARCGRPLPSGACSYCRRITMHVDGVRALAFFEGEMREAIHAFKYNRRVELAPIFGTMLKDYLAVHALPAEVIIPVPLHPDRERARGYNQAQLVANELGAQTKLPVLERSLVRARVTQAQFELNATERRANVRDAFIADGQVKGTRVLLVDDVCTTGATMDECSIALRKCGAQSVWGLALARGR